MAAILARLDAIQDQVSHVQIPLSYAEHLYHLRAHIGFVRQLVTEGPTGPAEAAPIPGPDSTQDG